MALLTLEHQTRMTNLINRVAWEARIAEADGKTNPQIDADIESLVTYMTFADEARLHSSIEGVSSFTKTFPERGPRDKQGRSLRDFDLQTRIFKYPLSYMIYSPSFDAIPASARDRIHQRLKEKLPVAVLEILHDTKPGW